MIRGLDLEDFDDPRRYFFYLSFLVVINIEGKGRRSLSYLPSPCRIVAGCLCGKSNSK